MWGLTVNKAGGSVVNELGKGRPAQPSGPGCPLGRPAPAGVQSLRDAEAALSEGLES